MASKMVRLLALLFLLAVGISIPVHAQGTLTYGTGGVGTISATTPVVIYTFQGQAGDSVVIQVMSLSNELQPTVSLNTVTGSQIASSSSDASNLASNSARINALLPETGIYTVIITSVGGQTGDYAIRLDGAPTMQEAQVSEGETSSTTLEPGKIFLVYTVPANETMPLLAVLSTPIADTSFSVFVTDSNNIPIGFFNGSSQQDAMVALPAGTGIYTLGVTVNSSVETSLNLEVVSTGEPTQQDDPLTTTPTDTPESDDVSEDDQSATPVTSTATATSVEQDSSSTTETPTLTSAVTATAVQQGTTLTSTMTPTVSQQNASPTVTSVPTASSTSTSTMTATVQRTATPTQPATSTLTPSYTPTTPPAAQTAPEDARFNNPLQIPLDSTVSVLDFVSYPGGDSEDRVRYEITGMNPNTSLSGGRARLVISASCFGQNTAQIQFFTGGQTYSCGQTLVDKQVTADSDTGSIVITAVGGEGTYVQWVLTGTATRTN